MIIWIGAIFLLGIIVLVIFSLGAGKEDNYDEIEQLFKDKKFDEAMVILKKAMEKKPEDLILQSLRLKILESKKEWKTFYEELSRLWDRDQYVPDYEKEKVLTFLGDYYYQKEEYETSLEAFLDLVIDYPENLNALKKIGFLAVGRAEFDIAIDYLEKAAEIEPNEKTRLTLAIAYHEKGREKDALEIIEKLLEKNPDNLEYTIYFILMSQKTHHASAREKIVQYYNVVQDIQMKFLFLKLYVYFSYHLQKLDEISRFLKRAMDKDEFELENLKEILYYTLVAHLTKQNFEEAKNVHKKLKGIAPEYRNLDMFDNFIIRKKLSFTQDDQEIQLGQIIEHDFRSVLPERFVFRISGLQMKEEINFGRFFDTQGGRKVLKREFRKLEVETVLNDFLNFTPDEFKSYTDFFIRNLGYTIEKRIPAIEENDLEFICQKKDDEKIRALISFYRKKEDSRISEIELENYQSKISEIKLNTGIIITNAVISPGAESKLGGYKNIQLITHERIKEVYKAWKRGH